MNRLHVTIAALAVMLVYGGVAAGQCQAPATWFPHETTPEPDFHSPASPCEFHQWAWQTFLWITQSSGQGRIRLMDLPRADELFLPGRAPPTLNAATLNRFRSQPLILAPRVLKKDEPTTVGDIRQAGSRGVLVDRRGRPVYYASHVSRDFYQFVRSNRLFIKQTYVNAPPTMNFPVRSLELKSSWRVVPEGEKADGFFTTPALIHPVTCRTGDNTCTGGDVVIDLSRTEAVTVALVGLHVVGVVEDHPEFIWATFEHQENAPDLPDGMQPNSPDPVSNQAWTFYAANTPAMSCNASNVGSIAFDAASNQLSPVTQIFRQFPFGGGSAGDIANIKSLNESVQMQLASGSVWKKYVLVGSNWFVAHNSLEPGLLGTSPAMQNRIAGSVRLSNATMETFTQQSKRNCFACHDTSAVTAQGLPAMNMNLSHILKDGLIQRDQFARSPASPVRTAPVRNYAEAQSLLNDYVRQNNIPIQFSPHRAFWNTMTYQQFTEGDIPGVSDPGSGKPLKVLVSKDSAHSNIIMALRGTAGTIFDPVNGSIGRMPPTGPFMSEEDINRLAAWIDSGCPNPE